MLRDCESIVTCGEYPESVTNMKPLHAATRCCAKRLSGHTAPRYVRTIGSLLTGARKDTVMFRRILVPLDGSPLAESAIPVAAKIAQANHGTIILLRVEPIPIVYVPALGPTPPLDVEAVEAVRTEFAGYLSAIAGRPLLANVATETLVLTGPPAQQTVEAVSMKQADLVLMTSHGRTGFSRWMLGSVAQQIAHNTPVPVLILRVRGGAPAGQYPVFEHLARLLVPLDGSPLAEAALGPAAGLAAALSSEPALHLVLVVSRYETVEANMPEALAIDAAKHYLGKVADRMKQEHPALNVTWSVGVGLDIAETIIRIAERGDVTEGAGAFGGCGAIAVATHGRTGIARWALGSISERVLYGTKLPLLMVRPPKAAAIARSAVAQSQATAPSDTFTWSALF